MKKEKTIYEFTLKCECGHCWSPLLVEFRPGETTRLITLTCPDCDARREMTCTRQKESRIPIKGMEEKDEY